MKRRDKNDDRPVIVTVEKVLPFGVFVRLAGGERAYIRRREMSWSGDIDPRRLVHEGDVIEAVIIRRKSKEHSTELSHRATQPDPWDKFPARFRPGDVVRGTVKDLMPYGVYVEIIPGVDGLIHLSELAPWPIERPDDTVWVGDDVEVVITRIDSCEKKVWLSIRRRIEQLSTVSSFMEHLKQPSPPTETVAPVVQIAEVARDSLPRMAVPVPSSIIRQVGLILVVEDQDDLRLSLLKWLADRGYQVEGTACAAEATEKLKEQPIGVCLVDIDLADGDGLALIHYLEQKAQDVSVVVMSISERLAERATEIEQLEITAILLKPLDLDELDHLLMKIRNGDRPTLNWRLPAVPTHGTEQDPFRSLGCIMRGSSPLVERLQSGLEYLLKSTGAEAGIVFHTDPTSGIISVAVQAGAVSLHETAMYVLEDSPVKDVIREEIPILQHHVSVEAPNRFDKLQQLLTFESCIGVPISAGGETRHALFLFHRRRRAFNRFKLRDTQAMATLFAVALESQFLEERIQALGGILLNGQLAAGLGHEVYNKISALEIQLRNLQSDYSKPQKKSGSRHTDFSEDLDLLLETGIDLRQTVGMFQSLMRTDEIGEVNVNEVIRLARVQLRPILGKERIRLHPELSPEVPLIPASTIRLQQVFLNIMLNAIQHMILKPSGDRVIRISTTYEANDPIHPVKVRFSDTGPGIHKRLWEKIFELGFSTRPGGTGLGLFIARGLVENMGGQLRIEKSVIQIGTSFLVELRGDGVTVV